jgi:hypothetical protein
VEKEKKIYIYLFFSFTISRAEDFLVVWVSNENVSKEEEEEEEEKKKVPIEETRLLCCYSLVSLERLIYRRALPLRITASIRLSCGVFFLFSFPFFLNRDSFWLYSGIHPSPSIDYDVTFNYTYQVPCVCTRKCCRRFHFILNSGGEFPMLTLWPYKLRLLYIVFAQRIPPVFPCIIHRWNSFSHTHEGWRGGDQIRSDKRFRNNPPSCLSLIQYFVCVVEREKAFRNSGWNREPWEKNEFLAFLHTHANSTSWWWWWWLCVCVNSTSIICVWLYYMVRAI